MVPPHIAAWALLGTVFVCGPAQVSTAEPCGKTYDSRREREHSSFASPDYPNNYTNNALCTWTINVAAGLALRLTFEPHRYGLEEGKDFVKVYETSPEGDRQETRSYTGDVLPPIYLTSSNLVEIVFTSDGAGRGQGFGILWESYKDGGCNYNLEGQTTGTITSPNYPAPYGKDEHCEWVITVPDGYYIRFTFHAPYRLADYSDNLVILERFGTGGSYSRMQTLSGDESQPPETYTAQTNSVHLVFRTDDGRTGTGFNVTWDRVEATCGGSFNSTGGTLSSPNYPHHYYRHLRCEWTIKAPQGSLIRIAFNSTFQLKSYLEINETNWFGESELVRAYDGEIAPPPYTSTGSNVAILFTSNGIFSGKGFQLTWETVVASSRNPCKETIVNGMGTVSSPHHPAPYDTPALCVWDIHVPDDFRVILTFQSPFDLKDDQDFVKILETSDKGITSVRKSYTGSAVPPFYVSIGSQVEIVFEATGDGGGRGFNVTWQQVERACGGQRSDPRGAITSPNYPEDYDNYADCTWDIQAPTGRFITLTFHLPFHLESDTDFLKIYERLSSQRTLRRSLTGSALPEVYTSLTNQVQLRFRSDRTWSRTGFYVTWETVDETDCGPNVNVSQATEPAAFTGSMQPSPECVTSQELRQRKCSVTFKAEQGGSSSRTRLCLGGQYRLQCPAKYNATITVSNSVNSIQISCSPDTIKQRICSLTGQDLRVTYEGNLLCPTEPPNVIPQFLSVYTSIDDDDDGEEHYYLLFLLLIIPVAAILIWCWCRSRKTSKSSSLDDGRYSSHAASHIPLNGSRDQDKPV